MCPHHCFSVFESLLLIDSFEVRDYSCKKNKDLLLALCQLDPPPLQVVGQNSPGQLWVTTLVIIGVTQAPSFYWKGTQDMTVEPMPRHKVQGE